MRAGLAIKEGRYQFAFACLLRAIELDSSRAAYFRDLGDMWLRKGRDTDALAAHTRAVELAPDDPNCHSDLGRVFVLRQQFEKAVAAYERALRLDPKRADIYVELGNALYMKTQTTMSHERSSSTGARSRSIPPKPGHTMASPVSIPSEANGTRPLTCCTEASNARHELSNCT